MDNLFLENKVFFAYFLEELIKFRRFLIGFAQLLDLAKHHFILIYIIFSNFPLYF